MSYGLYVEEVYCHNYIFSLWSLAFMWYISSLFPLYSPPIPSKKNTKTAHIKGKKLHKYLLGTTYKIAKLQ